MWLVAVYWASLGIIILTAIVLALHSGIPGGFVGTFWLGGVAIFGLAGFSQTPMTWLVGFMASLAGVCIWGAARWIHWQSRHRCAHDHRRLKSAVSRSF